MSKFNLIKSAVLASAATALVAIASPAAAQVAPTSTPAVTPTTTTGGSGCDFNCTNTTSIMSGVGTTFNGFGMIQGGQLNNDGAIVANPNVHFDGEVTTEGSGNSVNDLRYTGSVCGPLCGNTTLNAQGISNQRTTVNGTLTSGQTAVPIGLATSGGSMAGSVIQFGYQAASGTTVGTPTAQ